jgi:Ni,Fe-hydrogenase III small subunit
LAGQAGAIVGSAVGLAGAVGVLVSGETVSLSAGWPMPGGGLDFAIDDGARRWRRALGRGVTPRVAPAVGRSLRLRRISAGGCNGCEAEVNALGNVVFDASRFGIDFVASPRHADGVLITGPVTRNMREAALATYAAVAEPKLVIAAGACAISGGWFRGRPEAGHGIDGLLPVDVYIPGCPPHPVTILDGLLRLLGRI